ncbi:MAG: hypothetical protein II304_07900 [Bacteroidales bacterium]|nr:hypothetical protein [Bacteroidales bacterium]
MYKEIIFKNGNSIKIIPSCKEAVRSNSKIPIFFARGTSKSVTSLIQMFEYLYGRPLTKEEKTEIWSMFYGGE